ncbi:DNA-directed RNA polymerase, putative [Plasmodium knowlesi strain H]|uniref:DNA-directed RNA polymerase n=3 Tax=Plasmodium knowlesi TaxID=5850 RepID=A0A5K1V697_PLAKH|nr:DNA-directed RNA polymerase, putative [Plasmodium knowlesi strain H]OTN64912.1 DNA-directed RNA polymerase [Plasmodium knowlesi]CAA9988279.1 DNA-directed RNA polymerase, putative [Plasmodium knowlesi strain H]SBO20218.1 DNA-directed RNA polymerase, putative [Plasmodium knowlesi strain H]SBO20379.1 DNA-directed RNA polymerase, putative [Plasmodium knowlesi strain H]VVS77753.1 DNA-directed RNA polymerase, putative [Plasmodium knowlesi strain H]|eukprot:XP_002259256.1 dna-dependent rna polymerase, putative [Plasmodium knowlesi strain H]
MKLKALSSNFIPRFAQLCKKNTALYVRIANRQTAQLWNTKAFISSKVVVSREDDSVSIRPLSGNNKNVTFGNDSTQFVGEQSPQVDSQTHYSVLEETSPLRPDGETKNLDEQALNELHDLIRSIQKLDERKKQQIVNYINTLNKKYLQNVEGDIVTFFENLDQYMAANGLLMCDLGGEEILSHIEGVHINFGNDCTVGSGTEGSGTEGSGIEGSGTDVNSLFDVNFIRKAKKELYGEHIYPIIQDTSEKRFTRKGPPEEDIVSVRRQMLIERSSYQKAIEEAEEFVSNLHDLKKITEIRGLCKIYLNWVNELERRIATYRQRQRHQGGSCSNDEGNTARRTTSAASLSDIGRRGLPEQVEDKLLAIITVKWTIQYTFNPHKKKYANSIITQSKNFEQGYAYQSLFTHIAIKIGQEINNEMNFQELEKNNLLYRYVKRNKSNASFSHFQKYRILCDIRKKLQGGRQRGEEVIAAEATPTATTTDTVGSAEGGSPEVNPQDDFYLVQWNSQKKAAVGGLLLKMLMDCAKMDVDLSIAKEEHRNEYRYYLLLHKMAKGNGENLHADCKYEKELKYEKYYEEESNSLDFVILDRGKGRGVEEAAERGKKRRKKERKERKNEKEGMKEREKGMGNERDNKDGKGGQKDGKGGQKDGEGGHKDGEGDGEETPGKTARTRENNFCKRQKEKLKNKQIILYRSRRDPNKIELPVFIHSYIWNNGSWYGVIHMRECCANYLLNNAINSHIPLNHLPMISKPKKWTHAEGGMILLKNNFIRCNVKPLFNIDVCNLERIKNIVSQIGNVRWKINEEILNLIEYAYAQGITIGNIPRKQNYDLPNGPSDMGRKDVEDIKKYYLLKEEISRLNKCLISERPTFLQKIAVAKTLKNCEMIYFPHNIDFRGRMYPLSPHLHHMSDDICRSLITFHDKEEIGPRGLFWLKIHLSNNFGKDKLNFEERIKWVDDNLDNIKKLSENPFEHLDFWNMAEKPWQALSVSMDLTRALECPDPSKYRSNIPIQQDGTCNGLQHYAALGRDYDGGKAVNIIPSDEPQDIYTVVLEIVKSKISADLDGTATPTTMGPTNSTSGSINSINSGNGGNAAMSTPACRGELAKYCFKYDLLKRKVVKQTIMTICYGVTSVGAKDQVKGKIQNMISKVLDKNIINQLSQYIANYIFESISEIFKRAMIIKKWFNNLSKVTNELNIPVTWLSPIGLPCEQPYRLGQRILVNTPLQSVSVISYKNSLLHKNKQRLGFPPNFVHSLDASHLMMTAEKMILENNFSFAAVHDSYWAHACNVDLMNKFIRDSFVTLYNEPILQNLYQSYQMRLGKYASRIPAPPEQGHLDVSLVRNSRYFFS